MSVASDCEIEFCLAQKDPNGNSTTGITRTQTSETSFSTNDDVKYTNSGGKDAWNTLEYLNIWVCDLSGGLLGYAQFPGGNVNEDGVVCDYAYFGNIGTATPPYDKGRTATHEVGHWLNLRHIWGDSNCGNGVALCIMLFFNDIKRDWHHTMQILACNQHGNACFVPK